MASGSFNLTRTGSTSQYITFKVNWSSSSNGPSANSSTVYVDVIATKSSSSTSDTWGSYNVSSIVNNETKSCGDTSFRIHPGSSLTLYSTNYTVPHNDNGTKSTTISVNVGGNVMWGNGSDTATLDTIPRASEISSVSTVDIGSNATILVNRKSSSFTHTITYSFGSLSGTVATKSSNVSIPWTIPSSFYAQIPNSKTGSGTLTITTYSGNIQIGSSSTKSFSVSTNESQCKPVVDASVVDSNQATVNVTGNNKILIAGYSTANVSYTATPRNSASIKTVTVNGLSAYSGTSASAVSGTKAIANFNANKIEIVAKDSRTYSDTKTLTAGTTAYTLVNYIPLTFSGSVSRQTPTGDVLLLSFSGKYFNGNLGATTNTLTISWKWRVKGNTSWTNGGTLVQGTDYTINTSNNTYLGSNINLGNDFYYRNNYEIGVFYNDALVNTNVILEGKKGEPIVWWNEHSFNINGDLEINGTAIIDKQSPFASLDNFKSFCIYNAPVGISFWILNINGAVLSAILQKANNNYLSFIQFSYSVNAKQYKYYNGTWSEAEFETKENTKKGYAKIQTNFSAKTISSDDTVITEWEKIFDYGDCTADVSNNRIIVKNTKCLRLSGQISGNGSTWSRYEVKQSNGTLVDEPGLASLYQMGLIGNGYWSAPMPDVLVQLDSAKTYYVRLISSPYNGYNFDMNSGFGKYGTSICAEKIN